MKQLLIVPDKNKRKESLDFAKAYSLGFEYNDYELEKEFNDYLIVYEYSTKIQLLFFKLWYVPLILLIITIFNVIISSFSLRGALNKNTIDIIRQN